MPMLLVAFMLRNYDNLFMMMLTQMACKQLGMNIVEYLVPIFKVKKKLNEINKEYKNVISKFFIWTKIKGVDDHNQDDSQQ